MMMQYLFMLAWLFQVVQGGQRVKLLPGYTWANKAWGFSNGGRDSTDGMKVILVDPDYTDTSLVQNYISNDQIVMCYISAGTIEVWRDDYQPNQAEWDAIRLGVLENWTEESWLDLRKVDQVLEMMETRIQRAKAKGCQAIEPDNLDCYLDKINCYSQMNLTQTEAEQLSTIYVTRFAELVHSYDMAVVLKNAVELIEDVHLSFDGAISENCQKWEECGKFKEYFHRHGKAYFSVEYNGDSTRCDSVETMMKYCNPKSGNYLCQGTDLEWTECFAPVEGPLPPTEYLTTTNTPPTSSPPSAPPPSAPPTSAPPTSAPPTSAPPTSAPPTSAPPTPAPTYKKKGNGRK